MLSGRSEPEIKLAPPPKEIETSKVNVSIKKNGVGNKMINSSSQMNNIIIKEEDNEHIDE